MKRENHEPRFRRRRRGLYDWPAVVVCSRKLK